MASRLSRRSRPADVFASLSTAHMADATVLITGPTSGVGEEAVVALASLGCQLVLAARSAERVQAMLDRRKLNGHAKISFIQCDLASLESVAACADAFLEQQATWPPLKVLVLNAGVYNFLGRYNASADGFESSFAVNHLGHFLLALKLAPALEAAAPSRVVVVSSGSHFGPHATRRVEEPRELLALATPDEKARRSFGHLAALRAYGSSKLANTCFARSLHARWAAKGVTACSLHPGTLVATGLTRESRLASFAFKYIVAWFTKDMQQAASTTLFCSLAPHEALQGGFFNDCKPLAMSPLATDAAADALWELSAELCKPYLLEKRTARASS